MLVHVISDFAKLYICTEFFRQDYYFLIIYLTFSQGVALYETAQWISTNCRFSRMKTIHKPYKEFCIYIGLIKISQRGVVNPPQQSRLSGVCPHHNLAPLPCPMVELE